MKFIEFILRNDDFIEFSSRINFTEKVSLVKSSAMTAFTETQKIVIDVLMTNIITQVIKNLITQDELSLKSVNFIESQRSQDDFNTDLKDDDTNQSK